MPAALWLIALPMGAVPLVYLLRRLPVGAVLAAFVAFCAAWLAIKLPTGVVLNLLGRTIELGRLSQITLSLLFITTAILFLIPPLPPPFTGGGTTEVNRLSRRQALYERIRVRKGQAFYPVGLAILGFFVAASLSRHLGIAAIFIEGAAILTVFVIQGQQLTSTRAALRFLVLMSLATPLFLLAAWQIDFYQLRGGAVAATGLEQTAILVAIGFALWLAIAPFHAWLTTTAAEAAPSTAAFVLIVFPVVAFSTLLNLLVDFPWLVASEQLVNAIILAGVFTALVGGALAGAQRGFSELMGYGALYDLGCTLAMLGLGSSASVVIILMGLIIRALALTLVAASASAIRLRVASDGYAQVLGMARHMPVATFGLIAGGLTLAGVPFTASFGLRWELIQALADVDARWSTLIALAGLGVALGYLRGFRAMLWPRQTARIQNDRAWWLGSILKLQEPPSLLIIIAGLSLATIGLGVFPAWLIGPLQTLAAGISIPIR